LSDGFVPLWNPLLGLGTPLIANYQSALFYPPNGILFIVGPAWGHGLLVLLHIIWAGLGMRILCRELELGTLAQTVAALSFSLSGYLIARAGFLSINATAAWLPWIIFMAERLVKEHADSTISRGNVRSIFLLGILFAFSWLAGHAQTSWYVLVLTVTWVLWRGYYHQKLSGILRAGFALVIAGIMGFLLSAIQLLPVLEYLIHSHRAADLDLEYALNYSFWPWRLMGLFAPNLFGNPGTGEFWGYANYWEDAIYIGIFPLIVGLIFVIRTVWKRVSGGLTRYLFVVGLISFLFALGKNTPIYPFLFENIPTFNLFQAPTRWSILLVFSLALLAGLGVDEWEKGEIVKLFWVRLGTVGAITITIVALGSSFLLPDLEESFIPSIAIFGIWLSLIGIMAWRRRIRPSIIWQLLIGILVAVDLIWAGIGLNPTVDMEIYQEENLLLDKVSGQHRLYMDSELEQVLKFEETHRFDTFNSDLDWSIVRKVGIPNTTMLDNVASINNFDPILSDWYVEWLEGIETLTGALKTKWLRAVDVGWVARWDSNDIESMTYQGLPDPRRAHLIGDVIWVESEEESYEIVFGSNFDPFTSVVLGNEGDKIYRQWGSEGQITLLDQPNPNIVQVVTSTPTDSVLMLSDLWFPGWIGYLDGIETEIYRANFLLRAVIIPPGSHTVEFKYRPLSFTIGSALSAITLLSMGFVLWKMRRS
jgi:uncharacterized membrane protein YfhO